MCAFTTKRKKSSKTVGSPLTSLETVPLFKTLRNWKRVQGSIPDDVLYNSFQMAYTIEKITITILTIISAQAGYLHINVTYFQKTKIWIASPL